MRNIVKQPENLCTIELPASLIAGLENGLNGGMDLKWTMEVLCKTDGTN